jgi:hypothetical protein
MGHIKVLLAKHHRLGLTVVASLGIHGVLMGVPISLDAQSPKSESLSVVPLAPVPTQSTATTKPTLPVSPLSTPPNLPKFNPSPSFQWSPFSSPSSSFGSSIASNIAAGNFGDRSSTSSTNWQQLQQRRAEDVTEEVTEETEEETTDNASPTDTPGQPDRTSGTPVTDEGTPGKQPGKLPASSTTAENSTNPDPDPTSPPTPPSSSNNSDEDEQRIAEQIARVQNQIDDESLKFLETLPSDAQRSYISSSTQTGINEIKTYLEFAPDVRNTLFDSDGSKKEQIVSIHLLTGKPTDEKETYNLLIEPFQKQGFQIELNPAPNETDRQKYQARIKDKPYLELPYLELELIPLENLGTLLVVWKYDQTGTI